jgi:hypothetical protein
MGGDEGVGILGVLLGSHDLDLGALAVEVVEDELVTGGTDVVDAAGQRFCYAVKLAARRDLAFGAVGGDVGDERAGDMELVGIRIRGLGFFESEDLTAADFVVLLWKI